MFLLEKVVDGGSKYVRVPVYEKGCLLYAKCLTYDILLEGMHFSDKVSEDECTVEANTTQRIIRF